MVVVFGSINLDLVARVPRFAHPGETLAAESFALHPGGKGANQALAAARAGARVALVGAVGRDAFALPALAELRAGGVDLSGVRTIDGPTGIALIQVNAAGENAILIIAGANAHVDAGAVAADRLSVSTVLVLQQEVPAAANAEVARRARARGARIILNAAPARALAPALLACVDVVVFNASEMQALARADGLPEEPAAFARALAGRNGGTTVVTLGAAGVVAAERGACYALAAPALTVVDSTGAGDAFVGTLAAAFDRSLPLREALPLAVASGSLACTEHGAQRALPCAEQVALLAAALETRVIDLG
jgi:ribokinase